MKQDTKAPLPLSDDKISPVLEGTWVMDSEGNRFRIDFVDMKRQAVSLWASHGQKEICVSDLKFYSYAV